MKAQPILGAFAFKLTAITKHLFCIQAMAKRSPVWA
jgi:hypothetical protein